MRYNSDVLGKFIWVGDMHVQKSNIEESKRLIEWIVKISEAYELPVLFAGDQYSDFGIAHVEVFTFWKWAYEQFNFGTISLVGNHDLSADGKYTFMDAHKDYTLVVDKPLLLGPTLLVPFYRNNETFLKEINNYKDLYKTLICHQEFNGAKYDNGFYSSSGIDPIQLDPSVLVMSGHIHTAQKFSNIWYLGTPRQFTRSDIGNEDTKGIFIIEPKGYVVEFFPTPEDACEPFRFIEINEQSDLKSMVIPESSRVYIDIKGSSEFIKKTLKLVPSQAKVRTFPIQDAIQTEIKESDGIPKAFMRYAFNYFNDKKLGNTEARLVLSKIYEKCPSLKTTIKE